MIRQVSTSFLRSATRLSGQETFKKTGSVIADKSARCLSNSPWADYAMAPLDPIIGLNEQYNRDDFPDKVIVGVGAYRDDGGKPYVLPCVREAEERIFSQNLDMEYSGIVRLVFFPWLYFRNASMSQHKILYFTISSGWRS